MGIATTATGLLTVGVVGFGLFTFRDSIKNFLDKKTFTPEQIAESKAAEEKRAEKGAVGNTLDFIFGEGAVDNFNKFVNGDSDKPFEASSSVKNSLGFPSDANVIIDPVTGIIESDKPPLLNMFEFSMSKTNKKGKSVF